MMTAHAYRLIFWPALVLLLIVGAVMAQGDDYRTYLPSMAQGELAPTATATATTTPFTGGIPSVAPARTPTATILTAAPTPTRDFFSNFAFLCLPSYPDPGSGTLRPCTFLPVVVR